MSRRLFVMGVLLAGLIALSPLTWASAQTPVPPVPTRFPETNHAVDPHFVAYFEANGGVERFGYPFTRSFIDPQSGLLVQYFQKARMEWHPENPEPYTIQLGLLGDQLDKRQPPIPVSQVSASDPNCVYFPETGHKVCHLFLNYYRTHGGLDQFGYPISEYMLENGRLVQYFQRARMEWYPEKPEGQRVQLADLGEIYFKYAGMDDDYRNWDQGAAIPRVITSLQARGNVIDSVVAQGAAQEAHLTVVDQLGQPVGGAKVTLTVRFPGGERLFEGTTDAKGQTTFAFPVTKDKPGTLVPMEFVVSYGESLTTTTRTSFLIWYY